MPKSPTSGQATLEAALQKVGGKDQVEREASNVLMRFGGKNMKLFDSSDLTNCPAISQTASIVGGEVLGIWPDGADGINVPAHVRIRFGNHSHYSFILIIGKGSVLSSTNSLNLKQISSLIYLEDGNQ